MSLISDIQCQQWKNYWAVLLKNKWQYDSGEILRYKVNSYKSLFSKLEVKCTKKYIYIKNYSVKGQAYSVLWKVYKH